MGDVTLTINDTTVTVSEGSTILEAATAAEVYIPTLCYHPSLPTSKGLEPKEFIFRGEEKILSDKAEPY
ncbi:MAG TPA: 2Fe-2S iron-sulfur cluster binding domain-containing protein, partial [Chloroflexi bacterium]|nr:2Fe-2S iron-sulfur cluster binding domain-containing protein [Chloroflexota bacterium]